MIITHSPGKLIISGEHAVVYGAPALAMPLKEGMQCTSQALGLPIFRLSLTTLQEHFNIEIPLADVRSGYQKLVQRYNAFLDASIPIHQVLSNPFDLAIFLLGRLAEMFNLTLNDGLSMQYNCELTIGSGLGTSAAFIIATLRNLLERFKLQMDDSLFFQLCLDTENLAHGCSSGLDLRACLAKGGILYQQGEFEARSLQTLPFSYSNSGKPQSTTAECVNAVKSRMTPTLCQQFKEVTLNIDQALQQQNQQDFIELIRLNHQLLCQIGVVPIPIQSTIHELEINGGAAKICGAGSITGDQAGAMLIVNG